MGGVTAAGARGLEGYLDLLVTRHHSQARCDRVLVFPADIFSLYTGVVQKIDQAPGLVSLLYNKGCVTGSLHIGFEVTSGGHGGIDEYRG